MVVGSAGNYVACCMSPQTWGDWCNCLCLTVFVQWVFVSWYCWLVGCRTSQFRRKGDRQEENRPTAEPVSAMRARHITGACETYSIQAYSTWSQYEYWCETHTHLHSRLYSCLHNSSRPHFPCCVCKSRFMYLIYIPFNSVTLDICLQIHTLCGMYPNPKLGWVHATLHKTRFHKNCVPHT